jgi:DNA-directed RNA polymerase specialized sigma24 family protein
LQSPESSLPSSASLSPGTYHDRAEFLAAWEALSGAEIARLMNFARYRMAPVTGRLDDSNAKDLLHEALVKTLEGTRPWRRGLPFTHHLFGCMRSISHNWFEQAGRHTELSDVHASSTSLDSALDAQSCIDWIRERLGQDGLQVALRVLECWLNGHTAAETQQILGIPEDVYWAARKQIRRRAELVLERRGITHGR